MPFNLPNDLYTPPPSQDHSPRDVDSDVIQALKYNENGTIQQVAYTKLEPQEKENVSKN